jgi:hypothetical protein
VRDLTHLWQKFLLAGSMLVGLFIGVVGAVFGYSNKAAVDVHWAIFHVDGVPLWTVVVVPLGVFLVAGTLYHWMDGLHHFTEHMRHRHRVHELEAEVASLRAHLDQVLDMPDHSTVPRMRIAVEAPPPDEVPGAEVEPTTQRRLSRPKRAALAAMPEHAPEAAVTTNGGHEAAVTEPAP